MPQKKRKEKNFLFFKKFCSMSVKIFIYISSYMNDKTLFGIGIAFFCVGGIIFLFITQPWTSFQEKEIPKEIKEVVIQAPEHSLPSPTPTPQETPKIEPPLSKDFLEEGERFLEMGMYTSAIQMAQKKRETDPNNIRSFHILIDANLAIPNYWQAEEFMKKLLLLEKNNKNTLQYIEILLLSGKKEPAALIVETLPESAEKVFYQLILSVIDEDIDATKSLATTLQESQSEYSKTGEQFLQIFETYSTFRDGSPHYLRTMMANMLNILQYHALCIEFLKPTLREYPEYRDAWILIGNSHLSLKHFDLAERMLEKAMSLDPTHPKTPYFLGIALAELNQHDDAVEQFSNALKNGYTPIAKVERYMGDVRLRQKKYDEAVSHYQEAISDTEHAEFRDYVQSVTLSLKFLDSPDMAVKTATQMVQKFPENPRSFSFLGWALLEKGDLEQSRKVLTKTIEKDPDLPDSYLFMGRIYEEKKQWKNAFAAYKKGYEKGKGGVASIECAERYNALKKQLQEKE
jgi:tetratricopeptide (TPR) repeat protein